MIEQLKNAIINLGAIITFGFYGTFKVNDDK